MPTAQRDFPYIWATWLPRLLTSENSCEWAIWFKAHYRDWPKPPSDFDQAQWLLDHTALLNEQKPHWEASGYDVFVERQNSFQIRGQTATLAGRPDLLVVNDDHASIIDVKPRPRETLARCPDHDLPVRNSKSPAAVPAHQFSRRGRVPDPHRTSAQGRTARPVRPQPRIRHPHARRRPAASTRSSRAECRFCDITAADCPGRVDDDLSPEQASTTDF